mmetsp:Transcript_16597/g.23656  ORF Transcript_16597/g.23656 Transcript_16597/m.23656 type:complete len:758 (+) Transcript_16597:192-2465(+)
MKERQKGSMKEDKAKKYSDVNRGPLTGIRIKPAGAIPTEESSGFEDLDGFWSASAVDTSTPATEKIVRKVQQAKEKEVRKVLQQKELEQRFQNDLDNGITIELQSIGRGTEPNFSPAPGMEYATPPTTTPKLRPRGEAAVILSPVSLGSYVTPRQQQRVEVSAPVLEPTSTTAASSTNSVDETLTSPNSLPIYVRASHNAGGEFPTSEISNKTRTSAVEAAPTTPGFDPQSTTDNTPEIDADDPAGALDDLLASSKKARDRRISLANKLKTPSPSVNTTASEISKTPKSVTFAEKIVTTFQRTFSVLEDGNTEVGMEMDSAVDYYEEDMNEKESSGRIAATPVEENNDMEMLNMNDDDESDGDGPGFQMVQEDEDGNNDDKVQDGTSNTVESDTEESDAENMKTNISTKQRKIQQQRSAMKREKQREKEQRNVGKKKRKDNNRHLVEDDTADLPARTPPGGVMAQYKLISVDHYKDHHLDDDEEEGLRRSKRAKFPPLKWWKNERLIFESSDKRESFSEFAAQADIDMPIVTKVQAALPTPAKPKKTSAKKATSKNMKNESSKKKSGTSSDNDSAEDQPSPLSITPFDSTRLRSKYNIFDGNEALVWDEEAGDLKEKKLVAYSSDMTATRLPKTTGRGRHESNVLGFASQAFNVAGIGDSIPGWISGNLLLPPRAIKDAEGVGLCSQVFFVGDCQPGSIEFSVANPEENEYLPATAQRFLLSKGDFFHVPPSNVYRLENHSRTTECKVYWTIIRSFS